MGRDRQAFAEAWDVSRETLDRLERYEALIAKWNPAINLVARSTLDNIWTRHFADSAAAFAIAGLDRGKWVDLGSGGGFPGMVAAILAQEKAPEIQVICIESDIRKCEFLRTVARTLGLDVGVLSRRIEETPPQAAQVVSARALAPLPRLLDLAHRHLAPGGHAIFLKGANWRDEVETALETWRFAVENHPSPTSPDSAILRIGDIVRA